MPEPVIDPTTGKPVEPTAPIPPVVSVPAEEWGAMKARLDMFEKNYSKPSTPSAPAPPTPSGPTLADSLSAIDKQIDALDSRIDTAVNKGDPVSKLMRERDTLTSKRLRLQIKHEDIDPALSAGINTIDQLSAEVTRGKMPYLNTVHDDFDSLLNTMPAEQRMNPQVRQKIYEMAVGKNIDKITAAQHEETLRKAAADQTAALPTGNGRTSGNGGTGKGGVPRPDKVLSKDAIEAMRSVGKDPDAYYKGMGYKGGWAEFWEKRGKEYFGEAAED